MLGIFPSILMTSSCVRGGFLRGAKFFLNVYPKTNIYAKFDAFIRDVNVI